MQTNRYNGFDLIHKALKGMLYDAALQLQKTDFSSTAEANAVFEKVNKVLWMFERHAHHENTFILPAISKSDDTTARKFFSEHDEDERLTKELQSVIDAFSSATTTEEKLQIGSKIKFLFTDFLAFNLTHMNSEERILNPILWNTYTDEEILAMNTELRKSLTPDETFLSMEWMFRSVSTGEVNMILNMMKSSAPPPVYEKVFQMARQAVPDLSA